MSSSSKFFKKYTLNNKVEVPSLLAVAPMTLFGSNPDGTIGDEERNFYKQRATGIGLYIVGATCVSLEGLAFDNQPRAFDDKDLPSNKERVKIIKEQGALAINQIHHGGCLGLKRLSGVPVMAVSADVFNKELEKKGELKEDTKAVEITEKDILLMISPELQKYQSKLDMMVLKFMVRIIIYCNNFIQDIIIKELMNGEALLL